jgi:CubicO group peptidase (beta-lactamase class C family)
MMKGFRLQVSMLDGRELPSATLPVAPTTAVEVGPMTPVKSSTVATLLEPIRQQADVPAMAGGYIRNGVVELGATGLRDRSRTVAVQSNDKFLLNSNGKAMTATLAAVLVDRGVIRWNSTVAEMMPELRATMNPAFRSVTLEELLNHRSGIRDELIPDSVAELATNFRGSAWRGRQQLAPLVLSMPAGPRGGFSYSNVGYTVAGMMLERATGNTFEWLMQKHVFRPLGMTSAGFGAPGRGYGLVDQPRGHGPTGPGSYFVDTKLMSPAGEMHMNMTDWAKFLRVHLGERVNGIRLVSDATLRKLHTADPREADGEGYGFGWVHRMTPTGPVLWHNGANETWHSFAVIDLRRKTAAFAVTNMYGEPAIAAVDAAITTLSQRLT